MISKKIVFLTAISGCLALSACKKEAGAGGTSSIIGRVKVADYDYNPVDGNWALKKEYYAPDERVYVVYGADSIYSDDFDTDPSGYYRFEWLRKGTYKVFAYSEDTTGNVGSGLYAVEQEVIITANRTVYTAPELVVIR